MNKELFIKCVGTIYLNIDNASLSLETIAKSAGTSVSSLKRLFEEFMALSPGAFIRRLRMELAFRSIQNKNSSVLETALAFGFENHSAFTKRFRQTFGYAPTQAREKLNIVHELECITLEEPDIVELDDFQIQGITEKGLYFECAPKAWAKLNEKLPKNEMREDFTGIYIGIGHDNPHDGNVAENEVRFSAGISHSDQSLGIENIIIPGGQYARFRYEGKIWNIGLAYHYIYGKWLQSSAFQIDQDKAAFIAFEKFPQGMHEEKVIIHVPILK